MRLALRAAVEVPGHWIVAERPFGPGDFLVVAAPTEHRFEDFSDDLLVWRVFYGAKGGEIPA